MIVIGPGLSLAGRDAGTDPGTGRRDRKAAPRGRRRHHRAGRPAGDPSRPPDADDPDPPSGRDVAPHREERSRDRAEADSDSPGGLRGSEGLDRPERAPLPDRDAGGARLHQPERKSGNGHGGGGGCPHGDDRRYERPGAPPGGGGPEGGFPARPLRAIWPPRTRGRTGSPPRISSTTCPMR